jgi:hypothetical protein
MVRNRRFAPRLVSVIAIAWIGLAGCGKVPTWNEMTGGNSNQAAPAPGVTVPNTTFPSAAPAASHGTTTEDPAQVVAWFKSLQSMQIGDQALARLTAVSSGLEGMLVIGSCWVRFYFAVLF